MEMEPSRQRSTPSRSIYMVGEDGTGGAWRMVSQSTRSPICLVVFMISALMSFILSDQVVSLQISIDTKKRGKTRFKVVMLLLWGRSRQGAE
jgi:hypothetical protein